MNPNSSHQIWSKWVWFVVPGVVKQRLFKEVVANCARFGRKGFGSASEMRVRSTRRGYIVEVISEGHPAHDLSFVNYMNSCWERFFVSGFGTGTVVKSSSKVIAGSRQDGKPADQWLELPSIRIKAGAHG